MFPATTTIALNNRYQASADIDIHSGVTTIRLKALGSPRLAPVGQCRLKIAVEFDNSGTFIYPTNYKQYAANDQNQFNQYDESITITAGQYSKITKVEVWCRQQSTSQSAQDFYVDKIEVLQVAP